VFKRLSSRRLLAQAWKQSKNAGRFIAKKGFEVFKKKAF